MPQSKCYSNTDLIRCYPSCGSSNNFNNELNRQRFRSFPLNWKIILINAMGKIKTKYRRLRRVQKKMWFDNTKRPLVLSFR